MFLVIFSLEKLNSISSSNFCAITINELPLTDSCGIGFIEITLKPLFSNKKDDVNKEEKLTPVRVGFIGRPNTGKSTLVNNIIGQNRLVTGSEAGVTRDSIEVLWSYKDRSICIVDTAGLRKKSKIVKPLEIEMVSDTLKTVKYSNVCVLLVDGTKGR